jgi:hypothetical protein
MYQSPILILSDLVDETLILLQTEAGHGEFASFKARLIFALQMLMCVKFCYDF